MNDSKYISQLFLVGITSKERIKPTLELIKDYPIGGVLIYKKCYDNLLELEDLIEKLHDANKNNPTPLFIAIDQEGGRVNRLPKDFNNIPSAFNMSKLPAYMVDEAYNNLAILLHNLGINLNLAPVLDIKHFNDKHAIGDRAFSNNIDDVITYSDIFIKAHKRNNVVPVIKHFPGQGSLRRDSHVFLPILWKYPNNEVKTFDTAIKNGADALLVGHILIFGKTGIYPATLSKKFIQKEIREKRNYDGLIITDELCMKSISILYGKSYSVKKAIKAGNDIICLKYHPDKIKKFIKKYQHINVEDRYQRIINYKEKHNIVDKSYFNKIDIQKYNTTVDKIKKEVH